MADGIDDGGPAFPGGENKYFDPEQGMSLRDYFAAKAIGPIVQLVMPEPKIIPEKSARSVALLCYDIADAMIEARKAK